MHAASKLIHEWENSATGTRTRVARVRAEYPNQLDYSGSGMEAQGKPCRREILSVTNPAR